MITRKGWDRVEYEMAPGESIAFKLRRLPYEHAVAITSATQRAFAEMNAVKVPELPADGEPSPELARDIILARAEQNERFAKAMPIEVVRDAFRHGVRDVENLEDEDAGPITTGAQLFDVADVQLVFFVVMGLNARATMSKAQAKGSASPSTSSVASEANPSGSPAPSTAIALVDSTAEATVAT